MLLFCADFYHLVLKQFLHLCIGVTGLLKQACAVLSQTRTLNGIFQGDGQGGDLDGTAGLQGLPGTREVHILH